jgi:glycosyltransferase involved in cell wall biosynthesis
MVSFQDKLAAGLARRGVEVCYDLSDSPYQAVLVIGGTRDLAGLWKARRRGARIVQRLDGMNWLHRVRSRAGIGRVSLRHFLRAEYGNWLLAFIRARLAQRIVYQSLFSQRWWEQVHGATRVPFTVVYNGVDLQVYSPAGVGSPPMERYRVLLVEGSLMGGYELGLETAVHLVENLSTEYQQVSGKPVELMIVGRVADDLKSRWMQRTTVPLQWTGVLPRQAIPEVDRSAHLLYSSDIHAACPNSVIEALACGLPVLSYDTGALAELVDDQAGRVVPYGGDAWRLDTPDGGALAQGAVHILTNLEGFRVAARQRAETMFGLDKMVESYLNVLLK